MKGQNQEEMANPSPGESLKIWDSLSFQPSATLSTDSFEQDLGKVASPRGSLAALIATQFLLMVLARAEKSSGVRGDFK